MKMKKFFPKIIISILALAILIAPISLVFKIQNDKLALGAKVNPVRDHEGSQRASISIGINKAEAQNTTEVTYVPNTIIDTSASFDVTITNTKSNYRSNNDGTPGNNSSVKGGLSADLWDKDFSANLENPATEALLLAISSAFVQENKDTQTVTLSFNKDNTLSGDPLIPNTTYYVRILLARLNEGATSLTDVAELTRITFSFTTSPNSTSNNNSSVNQSQTLHKDATYEFDCKLGSPGVGILIGMPGLGGSDSNIGGCVAQLTYLFWGVAESIAHLSANFLDFFVYYSTNSSSYTNEFINKGWGLIRDIANIFFIIALLYIAIKTILSLNVTDNKKLIAAVILAALLINFSLFITQVVIDGSNILAKVFYNQIQPKNTDKTVALQKNEEKAISVALISNFNPQKLVTQEIYDGSGGIATFIFIALLCLAMALFIAYMFFSVALVFLARVISLWMSMIFSPIAFASYSFKEKIPGFGHDEWWKSLLQNAFLAPLFIFFLYLITMLSSFMVVFEYKSSSGKEDLFQHIMAIFIPFAITFALLWKAKKMVVEMSGDMGKAVLKVASYAVGTAGIGMVAAYLGKGARATVGRAGSAVAGSKWAKGMASSKNVFAKFLGNKAMDAGKAAGKGSWDIRGAKIFGKTLASTGLKVGEAKGKGGFEQAKKDQIAKRQERAQELEAGAGEKEWKDLAKVETEHQGILGKLAVEIEKLDKTIEKTGKAEYDARSRMTMLEKTGQTGTQDYADAKDEYKRVSDNHVALKAQKKHLREGKDYSGTLTNEDGTTKTVARDYSKEARNIVKDKNGNVVSDRSIKDYEDDLIPEMKSKLKTLNAQRKFGYASGMDKWGGKIFNYITSAGMHSGIGANEAAYKIRMDMKLDSGTKH